MRIVLITVALLTLLLHPALAQTPPAQTSPTSSPPATAPETFTINLRDADIRALSEQVSQITGRTLVLDPAITGMVTVISSQALDRDGVWELYQSVLGGQGFAAIPSGTIWRVVPQAAIKEGGGSVDSDPGATPPGKLDVITRLIVLKNFPAETAVTALRPLVASFGYIEAVAGTNALVITDTSENVRRIETIAQNLDTGSQTKTYTIRLQNADAIEVGSAIASVLGTPGGPNAPRIGVEAGSNLLLLTSDEATFRMVSALVTEMDVPGRSIATSDPVTRVYRLKFGDAVAMAEVLRGLVSGQVSQVPTAQVTNPVAAALQDGTTDPAVDLATPSIQAVQTTADNITIQASPETNAVVVRAPLPAQADIADLIAQLDTRRPQVLIEAAIVEVSGDISEALGIQLGLGSAAPQGNFAATSFSAGGQSLKNILTLLGAPNAGVNAEGLSIGLSRGDDFGVLIQALALSSKANLLSTPSITTVDNQPAEIVVGQNVPFRTGSFATDGNTTTPFTTIERQDVGLTMKVTPRVNQGDVVQLQISQEVSSLASSAVAGAADLVTNRRSIQTTVLADNGGTIVLGGLITDDRQQLNSRVPGLSGLPVLGPLFRARNAKNRTQTLFIFLRPTILRSRSDTAVVTGDRVLRLNAINVDTTRLLPPLTRPGAPITAIPLTTARPSTPAVPRKATVQKVEIGGVY
ncbi:MAG: type II secretion system secretin GspD [Candidatus Saccharibacteria bacterium]|nr:type II secretion system secretin GspD [Pseudorhodobacter sp.]